jgi:hypothetical protein
MLGSPVYLNQSLMMKGFQAILACATRNNIIRV